MKNIYLTGNPGMDKKVIKALEKQGIYLSKDQVYGTTDKGKVTFLIGKDNGENKFIISNELPKNKYGVSSKEDRTYKDGFVFASKNEMERWDYLLNIQRTGEIRGLMRQSAFILLDPFISPQKEWGKQLPMIYVADFVYLNISFRKEYPYRMVIEDSKTGIRTPEYKLKRKLLLNKYSNYLFFEV